GEGSNAAGDSGAGSRRRAGVGAREMEVAADRSPVRPGYARNDPQLGSNQRTGGADRVGGGAGGTQRSGAENPDRARTERGQRSRFGRAGFIGSARGAGGGAGSDRGGARGAGCNRQGRTSDGPGGDRQRDIERAIGTRHSAEGSGRT